MGVGPVGLVGGSTLVLGALLGLRFRWSSRAIGLVRTFAAGATLAMLASPMLPEAARDGGPVIGLLTSADFLAAVLVDEL